MTTTDKNLRDLLDQADVCLNNWRTCADPDTHYIVSGDGEDELTAKVRYYCEAAKTFPSFYEEPYNVILWESAAVIDVRDVWGNSLPDYAIALQDHLNDRMK